MVATRLLIVEDDDDIRDAYAEFFNLEKYTPLFCKTGEEGLVAAETARCPLVVLLDYRLPDMDGPQFAENLRIRCQTQTRIIFCSGWPEIGKIAKEAKAWGFLKKPFDADALLKMVDSAYAME